MPLEVKDLTISLPSGEPVAENISFQIEKEKCFRLSEVQVREKQLSAKRLWDYLVPLIRLRARLFFKGPIFWPCTKKTENRYMGKKYVSSCKIQ